ncbi:11264_t:CDS:2, partial [Funneliformis mosseae]
VIYQNELTEVIIYRYFAEISLKKSDLLSVKYSDTLESLERDQHLILINYAENDNCILIILPPIFIHLYIQALKSFVVADKLKILFLLGWKMKWHDFEILVAEHMAFKIKVELKEITVHQFRNKFLTTYLITNKQGEIVNFKSNVIVNGDKLSVSTKIPQEIIDKDDINNMTYSLYTDTIDLANSNKKRWLSYYDEVLQFWDCENISELQKSIGYYHLYSLASIKNLM